MMNQIRSVGIIGSGTMGQGIAQVCATAGFSVRLFDIDKRMLDQALVKLSAILDGQVGKNKISAEHSKLILNRILTVPTIHDLDCDLIIEAAAENLAIKQNIFSAVESVVRPDVLLTTNTSSIAVTRISSALKYPKRFAGLHFFNPAPVMNLVEVVAGAQTGELTIKALQSFCLQIGKQSVIAKDSPGFIVNRVARHYYVESLKLVEDNVADFDQIDLLMRNAGFRMGPFELMDLIGVDINLAVTSSVYAGFNQDPKFRPNRIQQQKVDAGHFGMKSGKGFYEYPK